jgi:hypothetical protein
MNVRPSLDAAWFKKFRTDWKQKNTKTKNTEPAEKVNTGEMREKERQGSRAALDHFISEQTNLHQKILMILQYHRTAK